MCGAGAGGVFKSKDFPTRYGFDLMALLDLLAIGSSILAVILIVYAVLDFFSLAHQVHLNRERDRRLVSHLVLMMAGALVFAISRLVAALTRYSSLELGLDVLALLLMVLAFYVHLRKTAYIYRKPSLR